MKLKPQAILARRFDARIGDELRKKDVALDSTVAGSSPLQALEMIYKVVDEFCGLAGTLVPCSKGCYFCCHGEVAMTRLEAAYITQHTGLVYNANAKALKPSMVSYNDRGRPCPFLDEEKTCGIYAARPLMCRSLLALEADNSKCQFGKIQRVSYMDRQSAFPGALEVYLKSTVAFDPDTIWSDIRDYFQET